MMSQVWRRRFLVCMFVVIVANYVAQVPYYLRLYYFPHHAPPALWGTLALAATLAWFLIGFALLWRGRVEGYWLTLSFLIVETGFYVYNEISQVAHGFPPFFHLGSPDPILWTVFAIGYLNMVAGVAFIALLVGWRRALTRERPPYASERVQIFSDERGAAR